jgi:hypothetical protein
VLSYFAATTFLKVTKIKTFSACSAVLEILLCVVVFSFVLCYCVNF